MTRTGPARAPVGAAVDLRASPAAGQIRDALVWTAALFEEAEAFVREHLARSFPAPFPPVRSPPSRMSTQP